MDKVPNTRKPIQVNAGINFAMQNFAIREINEMALYLVTKVYF